MPFLKSIRARAAIAAMIGLAFGLQAIDVGEYRAMLAKLMRKQMLKLRTFPEPQRQMRTLRYLSGRGFETDLVRQAMGRGEED